MYEFKINRKVWSIDDDKISEHVVEDIRTVNKELQIKINNRWFSANEFYLSLNKAMEVEEGHAFLSFK